MFSFENERKLTFLRGGIKGSQTWIFSSQTISYQLWSSCSAMTLEFNLTSYEVVLLGIRGRCFIILVVIPREQKGLKTTISTFRQSLKLSTCFKAGASLPARGEMILEKIVGYQLGDKSKLYFLFPLQFEDFFILTSCWYLIFRQRTNCCQTCFLHPVAGPICTVQKKAACFGLH